MESTPITLVICGASGDLTARKLIPSLYRLDRKKRLPPEVRVVGLARTAFSDEGFRKRMGEACQEHAARDWSEEAWSAFARRLFYVPGDASKPGGLDGLLRWFSQYEGPAGGRRLYYLSVAPHLYESIIENLGATGLNREVGGWRRLVIEKPFGRDLDSARALNDVLREHFTESQIFRIDHYLGKETVQNILVLRFANILFEPLWNSNYIDHVQISVAEKVALEGRGAYYDQAGVLRDMFQNHLLQLLALVAMEAPARFNAEALRNEKVKVLQAIEVATPEQACQDLVCGQYAGYRQEPGVDPQSRTPTFAAMRLLVDNWRWRGVPFFLRSGKALAKRSSEVVVQFRCPPHMMFPLRAGSMLECNRLSLRIQPDEGVKLHFLSKVPDTDGVVMKPSDLEFYYKGAYPDKPIPEAYERLLLDAINGDASLFMRSDEIERAWEIMDPFVQASERPGCAPPEEYAVGSQGPVCADEFLARSGRQWQPL